MNRRNSGRDRTLVALALKIAPAGRKEWFAAMAAEFEHVPPSARRHFAMGCIIAAIRERVISPPFLDAAARRLLIGGAMLWAALNIRFAGRMADTDTVLLEAFGYGSAMLFVTGALATARFGYRATIALAAPLMALLAFTATIIRVGGVQTPMAKLYLALVVEDLAVLGFAVIIALVATGLSTVRTGQS